MLKRERGLDAEAIGNLANGVRSCAVAADEAERERLDTAKFDDAPPHVAGDYPEWLDPHLACVFGDDRAEEGAALAVAGAARPARQHLGADRDKAAAMLADLKPEPTRWSPWGLRVHLSADAKSPAIHAEPAFLKGMIEIQDEGSQLAALFSGGKTRRTGGRSLRRSRRQDAWRSRR